MSPLSRHKSGAFTRVIEFILLIIILLIASMSTKIEYDNAISTIGTLPIIEPCPNIYNLLN